MLTATETNQLFTEYLGNVSEDTLNKLYEYYALIEEENQKYNLTGFYNEKLIKEGLIESILIFKKIDAEILNLDSKSILDIGSGAGFPIVPYFIYSPNFDLTIYEPQQKRVNFLNLVIEKLKLKNIKVKKLRAEESSEFNTFDFISARAVSELKNLAEISHKLGKQNSTFCFLKSNNYEAEINNALWIKNRLNLTFETLKLGVFFSIENNLVYYKKTIKTPPDLPRKWAQIIKNNLK